MELDFDDDDDDDSTNGNELFAFLAERIPNAKSVDPIKFWKARLPSPLAQMALDFLTAPGKPNYIYWLHTANTFISSHISRRGTSLLAWRPNGIKAPTLAERRNCRRGYGHCVLGELRHPNPSPVRTARQPRQGKGVPG
jgi:hypothetical protein